VSNVAVDRLCGRLCGGTLLVLQLALGVACTQAPSRPDGGPASRSARAGRARAAAVDGAAGASQRAAWRGFASRRFVSLGDSLEWEAERARAMRARGFRLVVSLFDRRLTALVDGDTLMTARVAVASNGILAYQGKRWRFRTPRGLRRVLRKDSVPVWVPPDWHYYEVAKQHRFAVRRLPADTPVALGAGRWLVVRDSVAGVVDPDSGFAALPTDEEIVFDSTLYIPPLGTRNRQIAGELGRYRLDLGDGYMLHGTPEQASIGHAATHGCIRLRDEDVEWLYRVVPIGTRVYVY
jgi:hypothetical protein